MTQRPHRGSRGAWLALALLAVSCSPEGGAPDSSGAPAVTPQMQRQRELAAVHFFEDAREEARRALAPLVAGPDAAVQDLVSAATVELLAADVEAARGFLERAAAKAPDDPAVNYNLARLAEYEVDFETARAFYAKARAAAPDDVPTTIHLAEVNEILGDSGRAEELLREVVARGVDETGAWHVAAVYQLNQILNRAERADEAAALLAEFTQLEARGVKSPDPKKFELGNFGTIGHPRARGNRVAPGEPPTFGAAEALVETARPAGAALADVDNDLDLDGIAWGPSGVTVARAGDGSWTPIAITSDAAERVVPFDLGNDDDLDLLVLAGGELRLYEALTPDAVTIEWRPWNGAPLPELGGAVRDVAPVDFDHEGDLDLLVVGDFGARLLRNDGAAAEGGAFVDASAEASLPRDRAFTWCEIEDLDTDQDVDLLFGGPDGTVLMDGLRGGRFADVSERLEGGLRTAVRPVVADLDGDARPDLWAAVEGAPQIGALWLGNPSARLARRAGYAPELGEVAATLAADLDLDGSLDALWTDGAGRLRGRLAVGLEAERGFALAGDDAVAAVGDLDADLRQDLVLLRDDGLAARRGAGPAGNAVLLGYRGLKDNRRAIGMVVELRAGDVYRRIFWRGTQQLVGVGAAEKTDWLRLVWPNGVSQYVLRSDLGDRRSAKDRETEVLQSEGLIGSCPFLYTWNGETYEFVSDVLGITPLGLPMAPGVLVPPDHDEYVLVTADQLVPRDGVYELQFTEELREVTYLDRVRLDVVDHPADTEIYPDERFCFPPFPEPHVHTVRGALAPARATGSDGGDWTAALAAVDDDHAAPFEPAPHQFLGLATPHWLELEFDPAAVRAAPRLRLVMTGWFYWTDASVNVAAARHPTQQFVPPILQVPGPRDPQGGAGAWIDAGPPLGFPAGKTKTMVIDVTDVLDRDDPRLRLFSTLRLYWDSIRLAVDADDAELVVRPLEPAAAELWERGFSDPVVPAGPHLPERFRWDRLARFPRWDQHPGLYTRFGDVLPLLGEVDDRFVVMGSGDALTIRFDADALPPVAPGHRRDFLVYLDGWAKDRDPNTEEALFVEPLPFHGMSAYPYGPDERFPDDAEHRRWRREWNTRPARAWIRPPTGTR